MTPNMDEKLNQTVQKASVLIDALPFIQKFRGSTVVIKYGGSAMVDERLKETFARDIVMMESIGIRPVIVHGGGSEITTVMERMGLEAQFYKGQRVTNAETLEIAEMVLAGKLNGEIVTRINRAGGRAAGLSGKDGGMIEARKMTTPDDERDMGFVGEVVRIRPEIIKVLIGDGFIPVISPIGSDSDGQTYNINADFVAAEIAAALDARKLVLLTDVRGICRDLNDETSLIGTIASGEVDALIESGVISGGMIPKVRAARAALAGGIRKTHILDGRLPHSILLELFTVEGIGTEIVP